MEPMIVISSEVCCVYLNCCFCTLVESLRISHINIHKCIGLNYILQLDLDISYSVVHIKTGQILDYNAS